MGILSAAGESFPFPGCERSYHRSNTSAHFAQQRLLFRDSFISQRESWIVHSLSVSHLLSLAFFLSRSPPFPFFFGLGWGVFSIRFHSILSETEHMLSSGGSLVCVSLGGCRLCTQGPLAEDRVCVWEMCPSSSQTRFGGWQRQMTALRNDLLPLDPNRLSGLKWHTDMNTLSFQLQPFVVSLASVAWPWNWASFLT